MGSVDTDHTFDEKQKAAQTWQPRQVEQPTPTLNQHGEKVMADSNSHFDIIQNFDGLGFISDIFEYNYN